MFRTFIVTLFALSLLLAAGCNLGFVNDDSSDGDASTAFYSYEWDTNINARSVIYHNSEDDIEGTLLYIEYYDLDEQGNVVFIRTNYPPVGDEEVGVVKSYAIYEWDGGKLVQSAFFDDDRECTGLSTYEYDSSGRVVSVYGYGPEGTHNLTSGYRYQYDSAGHVSLRAVIEGESNSAVVTAGAEYQYDSDNLFRRSTHKEIGEDGEIPDPGTLNAGSAACSVPSVSTPAADSDCSYEEDYNSYIVSTDDETTPDVVEDDVTAPIITMPELPGISDIDESDLLNQVYALPHIWDSYWFHDALGTDAYWGVTFNADPIPVDKAILEGYDAADDMYDTVYGLVDESDYTSFFSDYMTNYDPGNLPETFHMPVQFYIDVDKGINLSADSSGNVDYEFDRAITIDMEYVPGYNFLKSKVVKYGDEDILRIDSLYNDSMTHTAGIVLQGNAVPTTVEIALDYFNETCEGSWPESLEISLNDRLAQRFEFELGLEDASIDPASLEDWAILADSNPALWWYDGEYQSDASDEVNKAEALVGSFVYDYTEAEGDHVLALNSYDDDDTYLGAYKLIFSPDDLGFQLGIFGSDDETICTYSHDFGEILSTAEEALNVWDNGVDTYEDIYDQWLDVSHDPSDLLGEAVPEIPSYLLTGFGENPLSFNPLAFILNEIQGFIPVELTPEGLAE